MAKIWALILALAALLQVPLMAGAEEVPDLVGNWTSDGSVVRLGALDHFPEMSSDNLTFKDGISQTLVIEEQNGRRFAGLWISNLNPEASEAVLGVIGFDDETVYMVDEDGHIDGRLISATEMELVYREVDPDGMIVSISRYTKA
jgi:hypothetical protein